MASAVAGFLLLKRLPLLKRDKTALLAPAFDGWLQKTLKSRENTEQGGMIVLKVGFQNLTYVRRVSDVN